MDTTAAPDCIVLSAAAELDWTTLSTFVELDFAILSALEDVEWAKLSAVDVPVCTTVPSAAAGASAGGLAASSAADDDEALEAGSPAGGVAPLDGSFGALFDAILMSSRLSAGDVLDGCLAGPVGNLAAAFESDLLAPGAGATRALDLEP